MRENAFVPGEDVDVGVHETLPPGTILGKYCIDSILGVGGMGCVYLAVHQALGRKVALKMLHPEFANDPKAAQRFFAEARAVNQIHHENIVEITDFVETEQQKYYIMELLEGADLSGVHLLKGTLTVQETLRIAVQAASALEAVHSAGMVHRDLKPENIYVIKKGGVEDFVKLLDFGVAKLQAVPGQSAMSMTAAGTIVGTPDYMSPEQATGKDVDHRTDIYSLGAIMYEMVVGRKPFEANSLGELVAKHLTTTPTRPSRVKGLEQEIPADFERLVMDCLEMEPAKRPDSMTIVVARIREISAMNSYTLSGEAGPGAVPRGYRPRRSKRALFLPAAGFVVAGIVAGVVLTLEDSEPASASPPAVVEHVAPQARTVTLTFDSRPQGAAIYKGGEELALGVTPIVLSFDRKDESLQFEFRLDGHDPVVQDVPLSANLRVSVVLSPKVVREPPRKRPPKKKKKKKKRTHRRGVIDPFAD